MKSVRRENEIKGLRILLKEYSNQSVLMEVVEPWNIRSSLCFFFGKFVYL